MASPFQNSVFYKIISQKNIIHAPIAILGGVSGSRFANSDEFSDNHLLFLILKQQD